MLIFNFSSLYPEELVVAQELLLLLFHIVLPCLKPGAQRLRESKGILKSKKIQLEKFEKEVCFFLLINNSMRWDSLMLYMNFFIYNISLYIYMLYPHVYYILYVQ